LRHIIRPARPEPSSSQVDCSGTVSTSDCTKTLNNGPAPLPKGVPSLLRKSGEMSCTPPVSWIGTIQDSGTVPSCGHEPVPGSETPKGLWNRSKSNSYDAFRKISNCQFF